MSPHERVKAALTAWLDNLVSSGSREEIGAVARTLCDFAGRFAWMAELADPAGLVRLSIASCEQHESAAVGLEFSARGADVFDAVSERIEGEQLLLALQQLSDMGCERIVLELPEDGSWKGTIHAPTGMSQTLTETPDRGVHLLLQRLAVSLGAHLKAQGRGRLDA